MSDKIVPIRNKPLEEDKAIAKQFHDAASALADVMTKGRAMGLQMSFDGINNNQNPEKFMVINPSVRKLIEP